MHCVVRPEMVVPTLSKCRLFPWWLFPEKLQCNRCSHDTSVVAGTLKPSRDTFEYGGGSGNYIFIQGMQAAVDWLPKGSGNQFLRDIKGGMTNFNKL